jgi:hypothetical protein
VAAVSSYLMVRVPVEETEIHDGKAYIFCDPEHECVVGPFDIARLTDHHPVTWAESTHPGGAGGSGGSCAPPPHGYTPGVSGGSAGSGSYDHVRHDDRST